MKTYGRRANQYQTDVYTRLAVSTIRRQARRTRPFFMNVAYLAPHVQALERTSSAARGRAVAAPRHAGRFTDEPLPRSSSFNEADVSGKPRWLQAFPRLSKKTQAEITAGYDVYLESLLAVDEGVGRIIAALDAVGELDNTIVLFTSDNGFFFGEHRIAAGKDWFYEPSIRVPLMMRGPGVPRDAVQRSLVANIDLAPTILEFARAQALREMDGRSMVPLLEGQPGPEDRAVLLQNGGPYRPNFGVRTPRYVYIEYDAGDRELYDLRRDPGQLRNLAGKPAFATVQATLAQRLAVLKTCAGPSCR
jgi:arylsulfatase A-like enzyme